MEVTIREYSDNDAEEVRLIFAEFVKFHTELDKCFSKIPEHCDKFIDFIETCIKNNDHVAVAECNNKIVGYCISKIEQKPPIYPVPTYGYIDNIGVISGQQKKGIGSMLFRDALEWFRKNDIKRLECFAATANVKSTSFWRRMGFNVYMEQMYLDI